MFSLQSGLEALIACAGGIYIIGQIKATAEANRKGLETLKSDLTTLLEKNNTAMHELLDSFKIHQRENLEREVSHLKDLLDVSIRETREDIKRLEARQSESNRVKERLALAEASIRSLHRRLDTEPPIELPE